VNADAGPARPAPEVTPAAVPFWAAAREHRLVIQRCPRCDRLQHYPRPWCTECLNEDLEFVSSAGIGTVHSYTVIRRTAHPAFVGRVPYVFALVDLDEGVRVVTNVVGCEPDAVHIGHRVRVCFETIDDEYTAVLFEPEA
jgi:uncharacterized OB-fold protein